MISGEAFFRYKSFGCRSVLSRLSETSTELLIFCFLRRYHEKAKSPQIVPPTATATTPIITVPALDLDGAFEQRRAVSLQCTLKLADWGICCGLRVDEPGPNGSGLLGLRVSSEGQTLSESNPTPHRPVLFPYWNPLFSRRKPSYRSKEIIREDNYCYGRRGDGKRAEVTGRDAARESVVPEVEHGEERDLSKLSGYRAEELIEAQIQPH